jgi:hypothetical protein
MASVASALDTSVAYLMGETDDSRRNAEPQSVNTVAVDHSTAIGSIGRQNTITLAPPEAKTNVTVEGEGIIFEYAGKRIIFPKDTPQEVITATIGAVL